VPQFDRAVSSRNVPLLINGESFLIRPDQQDPGWGFHRTPLLHSDPSSVVRALPGFGMRNDQLGALAERRCRPGIPPVNSRLDRIVAVELERLWNERLLAANTTHRHGQRVPLAVVSNGNRIRL
jgi:hypothetical protein